MDRHREGVGLTGNLTDHIPRTRRVEKTTRAREERAVGRGRHHVYYYGGRYETFEFEGSRQCWFVLSVKVGWK
jgi:hypothetical protein